MTVKKRIPRKQINHYSKWKYVVLIATIIVMVLSALPSWYGENASVQINNRSEQTIDASQITQYLASEGIQAKSAFQKDNRLVVILEDAEQQAKAKEVLNEFILASDEQKQEFFAWVKQNFDIPNDKVEVWVESVFIHLVGIISITAMTFKKELPQG